MTIGTGGKTEKVGIGLRIGPAAATSGIGRYVDGPGEVLELMNQDVSNLILIVREAGTTGVAPILPDARGVVCTSGGPTSHLALVAKEYGVACVMAAKLECEPASLNGQTITLGSDGSISVAES
jgi:phosphoenolpyruvate-protein kinase (PTS system EI component)